MCRFHLPAMEFLAEKVEESHVYQSQRRESDYS